MCGQAPRSGMRYLRVTARIDPDASGGTYRILAGPEYLTRARLEEWNLGGTGVTFLYAVEGDYEGARDALAATPAVTDVGLSPVSETAAYLLVDADFTGTALGGRVFGLLASHSVVVLKPVVYEGRAVQASLVGADGEIQAILERLPDGTDVSVREISGSVTRPTTVVEELSDRQREALRAAIDIGYYDQPRQGTHEDVAERLDCAASTATEHIQRAEAKLVRAAVGG